VIGRLTRPTSVNGALHAVSRLVDANGETAAQGAYSRIKDLIVTLQLPPGSTIHEPEVQRQFGVGRTPLREALLRLYYDGMVQIYPRRAIVVTKLGVREVRQLFEMRVILERSAASLAAQRATDVETQELLRLGVELRASHDKTDASEFLKADLVFHRTIAHYAQNAFLWDEMDRILTLNLWLWNMYFAARGVRGGDLLAHKPILDAIVAHDAAAAEAAMAEHILHSRELLLTGLP